MPKYIVKIAETEEELKQYFQIRHEVFVKGQKIFSKTDKDEYDKGALHIIAIERLTGDVVGVVRCYNKERNTWFGGRLGAAPGNRNGRVGHHLVRFAVSTAKAKGCEKFHAHVQLNNVKFFQRLDWKTIGDAFIYQGFPHHLMEAKLDFY